MAFGAVSCADEGMGYDANESAAGDYSGTIEFSLTTPNTTDRTRAVNMNTGASLTVANLWLGIFDVNTGQCIGAMKNDSFNTTMVSGTLARNILQVDFVAKGVTEPLAYVVAVANYDGVKTWDGRALSDILPDFDRRGEISWDWITNLGIDTSSAYAGNKGENSLSSAPFMAGFYQDALSLTQNPKVDQMATDSEHPTAIYPASAAEGIDLNFGSAGNGKNFVAAGAICLRRLVSQNNLRFNTYNGYELTSVKYKRHNMPRSVYLLQRRTDTTRRGSFEEWQKYSPNFADRLLTEGNYDPQAASFPYESDRDWQEVSVNSWDNAAEITIPFDHFENKHWGFGNLLTQEDREVRNPDGTFAALCSGQQDAYNNFASYFSLSLHIINRETGESADVEYTLHEGFCNDDDGRLAQTQDVKCRDFGSFRNVVYNYNINIAGISDITASVTSEEGNHPGGQTGSIWKMEMATGSSEVVPVGGGDYTFGGRYMSFGSNPDLGFRIYGIDDKKNIVDFCYNMPQGMYEGFAGIWPVGNPTYINTPDASIPSSLLQGMKVVSRSGAAYSIPEFVKGVNGGSIDPRAQYFLRYGNYDGQAMGLTENLRRGIFIFDRNDSRNASDADGCSTYKVAYGGLQNAIMNQVLQFNINRLLVWDNTYYKSVSTVRDVQASLQQIFYGAESSAIDMRWKHDSRIRGYEVTVYNANFTSPTAVIGPESLGKYLHVVGGETIVIYPFSTAGFPGRTSSGANNYSFRVVPIVDENIYKVEGTFDCIHNQNGDDATCVRVCYPLWEIFKGGSTDWRDLLPVNNKFIDAHYRGLHCFGHPTKEIDSQYNSTAFLCFGGAGSVTMRYFKFVVSVPGKFEVKVKNHASSDDKTRLLNVVRVSDSGTKVEENVRYDEVYKSTNMPTTSTTFTVPVTPLNNQPTEFRIFAAGSVDYYSIQFKPN